MKRALSLFLAIVVFATSISLTNFIVDKDTNIDEVQASGEAELPIELKEYFSTKEESKTKPTSAGFSPNNGHSVTYSADDELTLQLTSTKDMTATKSGVTIEDNRYMVFQMEISRGAIAPKAQVRLGDKNNNILRIVNGKVYMTAFDGSKIKNDAHEIISTAEFTEGVYHDIAIVMDWQESKADVYVDGEIKVSDVALRPNYTFNQIQLYMDGGNGQDGAVLKFRNLRLYEGTKPRDMVLGTPGTIDLDDAVIASGLPTVALNADPVSFASLFTVAEKEYVIVDGQDAKFYLDASEGTQDLSNVSEVEHLKDCAALSKPFTLNLYKKFTDAIGTPTSPVAAAGQDINVTLTVPDTMKPEPTATTKRIYQIYELDASTGVLTATRKISRYEDVLTFEAVSGKTYVLGYVDSPDSGIAMTEYFSTKAESKDDPTYAGFPPNKGHSVTYSAADDELTLQLTSTNDMTATKSGVTNKDRRYMIFQMEISRGAVVPKAQVRLGDKNNNILRIVNGKVYMTAFDGSKIKNDAREIISTAEFTEGVYHDIAVVMDWQESKADVYVDGQVKASGVALRPNYTFNQIQLYMDGGSGQNEAALKFRNLRLYEGTRLSGGDNDVEVSGKVELKPEVEATLPKIEASGDFSGAFTTLEKEQILLDGKNATVALKLAENKTPATDKISNWTEDGYKQATAFDVKLTKKIDGGQESDLAAGNAVDVKLTVPESMQGNGTAKRTFTVFELTSEGGTALQSWTQTELDFAVKAGATYVLAYQDVEEQAFINTELTADYGWTYKKNNNAITYAESDDTFTMEVTQPKDDGQKDFYVQRSIKSDVRETVIEATLSWKNSKPKSLVMQTTEGKKVTLISCGSHGINVCGQNISSNFEENKEYKIAIAIDWKTYKADAYLNGKLAKSDISIAEGATLSGIRLYMGQGSEKGSTAIFSGVKAYEGKKPANVKNGTITTNVQDSGAPVSATLNTGKKELTYAMLDAYDLALVMGEDKVGRDAELSLVLSKSTVSQNVLSKYKGGQLFEMKLLKTIGNSAPEEVIEAKRSVEVTVSIPEWILKTPMTGKGRIYQIVRVLPDGTLKNIKSTHDNKKNTLTFKTDIFSAAYAVIFDDAVIGDKVFLNTVPKGLASVSGAYIKKGYMTEEIDQTRLVYDYIKMPTQAESYFMQVGVGEPTRFMTVHMKLAWETDNPEMYVAWRDQSDVDGTLFRVKKDGKIYVSSDEAETLQYTGKTLSKDPKKYTEIALVIDFETHIGDVYIDDMETPLLKNWQFQSVRDVKKNEVTTKHDFGYPKMFRLWLDSKNKATDATKGVDGSLYVKDWTIYESDVPKDINAGLKNTLASTGKTIWLNTIRNGVQGLKLVHQNNLIELRDAGLPSEYIHMQIMTEKAAYTQFNITAPTRYMVFQYKWAWQGSFPKGAIEYKDINGKGGTIMSFSDNALKVAGSTIVKDPVQGKYYDIAIAIDWETHIANVWVDGKAVKINVQMAKDNKGTPLQSIGMIRTQIYGNNKVGTIMKLKDYVIYEGSSPRKITKDMETSEIPVISLDNSKALKILGNSVAMAIKSDAIYYNGAKHSIGVAARKSGETPLFPVKAIAQAFGLGYQVSGSRAVIKGVSVPIQKVSGEVYLPLNSLKTLAKKALGGKTVTYVDRGYVVIGNGAFTEKESEQLEALHYLLYERPTVDAISKALNAKKGTHPTVIMDSDMLKAVKQGYKKDALMQEWGDHIIKSADNRLLLKVPEYKLTSNKLLAVSRRVYEDAQVYSMAYLLTEDVKYVNALYQTYKAAAEFPDWHKSHFLDTAEMMMAFTIGYDWLYDVWTPEQKSVIEKALYEKGLKVSYDIYFSLDVGYDHWWEYTDNNWAAVCHGSILATSVALYDKYPEVSAKCIQFAIRGVENMMDGFYPSGAWVEGPDYWAYLMDYQSHMIQTMDNAFGTDFGISKAPAFEQTMDYYLATNGPAGQNNYHDAASDGNMNGKSLMWLAKKFDTSYVRDVRKAQLVNEQSTPQVVDLIYYPAKLSKTKQDEKLDYYLKGMELVSLRESFEDFESAWVSFHAGDTNINHGQLDTGTYVVDMLGERWAIDLGSDSYSIVGYDIGNQTKRYTPYRKRPEGHNLYVINPAKDRYYPGQNTDYDFTEVETFETKSRGSFSIIDLTNAYKRDVSAAKRGYMLANDRRSVVIRDEMTLKGKNNTYYWFNHINDETTAEVIDKNTVKLTQNGQTVKMMILTNLKDYKVSVVDAEPLKTSPLVDGQNKNKDIQKIQITSKKASGDAYVQVKFIPWDDPAAEEPFENIPLSEWSIPDGELEKLPNAPMLKGIYRDGKKLYNFKKSTLSYTISIPYNEDKLPEITAKADKDCKVEITKAKEVGEYTEIKVSWKDCPESYRIYRVMTVKMDKLEDVYGYYRLQVYDHSASSEPEETHPVTKLSDNDLDPESRWVSDGEHWACLDLGSEKKFEALALAWWKGDTRNYYFTIEISNDGENFTPLLENKESKGDSALYEMILLDEQVSARYVRYRGYGNNENGYNSLTEFAVLTKELQDDAVMAFSTPVLIGIGAGAVAILGGGIAGAIVFIKKKKKKVAMAETGGSAETSDAPPEPQEEKQDE